MFKIRNKTIAVLLGLILLIPAVGNIKAQGDIELPSDIVTHTFTFDKSDSIDRSDFKVIAGLRDVKGIRVIKGGGTASYNITGSRLEVSVTGGSVQEVVKSNKVVTETIYKDTEGELPQSIEYNKDGYTGTLNKSGASKQAVKSGSPANSKFVEHKVPYTYNYYYEHYGMHPVLGDLGWWYADTYTKSNNQAIPTIANYNDGEYKGTVTYTGNKIVENTRNYPEPDPRSGIWLKFAEDYSLIYTGTVSKPDDRVYWRQQNYSGTVYGEEIKLYEYIVEVDVDVARVQYMEYYTGIQGYQSINSTINLPNLSDVIRVSVNTGSSTFTPDYDNKKIEVYARNGSYVNRYRDYRYVTDYRTGTTSAPTSTYSFPSSISVTEGQFSGTITRDGSYSTVVTSGSPAGSKQASFTSSYEYNTYRTWDGKSWTNITHVTENGYNPGTYYYYSDSEGYSGRLESIYGTDPAPNDWVISYDYPPNPTVGQTHLGTRRGRTHISRGTVTKPDTRNYRHTQWYSGSIPSTYWNYEYAYNITIEYIADSAGPPGPFINPTSSNKERGGNIKVKWKPTTNWGYGVVTSRQYEMQFYDGTKWSESVFTSKQKNPDTELDFNLPYSLNTNKVKFRVRSVTSTGTSEWVESNQFILDNTPPTASFSPKESTLTNNKNFRIKVNVGDQPVAQGGSGVKTWRYRVSLDDGRTYGEFITPKSLSDTIHLNDTAKCKVIVEVEDNVGWVTETTSGTYELDIDSPTAGFSPSEKEWTDGSICVDTLVDDIGSGIVSWRSRYKNITTGTTTGWNNLNSYINDGKHKHCFESEGIHKIEVELKDKAGNTALLESGEYKIDKTPPTHQTATIGNEKIRDGNVYWFKEGDTAHITLTGRDNLSGIGETYLSLRNDMYNFNVDSAYKWKESKVVEVAKDVKYRIKDGVITRNDPSGKIGDRGYRFNVVMGQGDNRSILHYLYRDNSNIFMNRDNKLIGTNLEIRTDNTPPELEEFSLWHIGYDTKALEYRLLARDVNDKDDGYEVGLHQIPYEVVFTQGDNEIARTTGASHGSNIIDGLWPNTEYGIEVNVKDRLNNVTREKLLEYTLAATPAITSVRQDAERVIVEWDPNGNPEYTRYNLQWAKDPDFNHVTGEKVIEGTIGEVTMLEINGTNAFFKVRAINNSTGRGHVEVANVNYEGIASKWSNIWSSLDGDNGDPGSDDGYYGGHGFRITKIADPRWENDFFKLGNGEYAEIGYSDKPNIKQALPAKTSKYGENDTIGIGYGINFAIGTFGMVSNKDYVNIDTRFYMQSNPGYWERVELYYKGIPLANRDMFNNIKLKTDSKHSLTAEPIDGVYQGRTLQDWHGEFFIPAGTLAKKVGETEYIMPEEILVMFNITLASEEMPGVNYKYTLNEHGWINTTTGLAGEYKEVFIYDNKRSVYEDLGVE